jgi:hypothetical protein
MTNALLVIHQGTSGMSGVEEYRYLIARIDTVRAALQPAALGRAIARTRNLAAAAVALGVTTTEVVDAIHGLDEEDRALVDLTIEQGGPAR